MPEGAKPNVEVAREQHPRVEDPKGVRYPRTQLVAAAAALLESTPSRVEAALAQEPDKQNFTLKQAADLVKTLEGNGLDPYAGVAETYVIPPSEPDEVAV